MIAVLEDISKSFGAQKVLENISVRIDQEDRIGLIGSNGAGKSTLLNIINNDLDCDSGTVSHGSGARIGFLRQNSGLNEENSIQTEMRSVFAYLDEMDAKMRADEKSMAKIDSFSEEYKTISARYASIQNQFELAEGYQIDAKIGTVLNGMGFGDVDRETPIYVLSGGEKTRLALCKLLLEAPELLIMDEPTNHLDFPTLIWLEDYLQSYKGALLVVSHDRFFLDKICKSIWDLENKELQTYKGNYTKYLILKQERLDFQQKEHEKQQEEIVKLKDFVARNLVRASTTKRAQSRQNILDKMVLIPKPKFPPKPPSIRFEVNREPVSDVLILEDIALSVGEEESKKQLFQGLDLGIKRGEKIALVGRNGIGKSSLLKALLKKIPFDTGTVSWGRNTDVAYFEQGEGDMNPSKQVIQELWDDFPREIEHSIRSTLGHAGLRGEEVYKKVRNLSGGERARLKFAKLMLREANVLLLDEPTNHLDLATKEVLDKALESFEGTLLVVSHDRYLLNKFPDKIAELKEDGMVIYPGKYSDYIEQKEKGNQVKETALHKETKEPTVKDNSSKSYRTKEQRKQDAQRKQRLNWLEAEIEKLEVEIFQLEEEIALPEIASNYEQLEEKCSQMEKLRDELEEYMVEWAEMSED